MENLESNKINPDNQIKEEVVDTLDTEQAKELIEKNKALTEKINDMESKGNVKQRGEADRIVWIMDNNNQIHYFDFKSGEYHTESGKDTQYQSKGSF